MDQKMKLIIKLAFIGLLICPIAPKAKDLIVEILKPYNPNLYRIKSVYSDHIVYLEEKDLSKLSDITWAYNLDSNDNPKLEQAFEKQSEELKKKVYRLFEIREMIKVRKPVFFYFKGKF